MRRGFLGVMAMALVAVLAVRGEPARAEELPTEIGACSETTIEDIGYRLGDPDSGSAISYANGGGQVSYDTIPEIHRSRVGDPVRLCLVSIPEECPPGDDRGKVYSATNLRTGESWEAPDSQHSCGGA
ncbi:MAG TPA: hypothetical protein VK451_00525 [Methyloceanibacter sp.]|nr:hypothetical protein [Methyloceanibacter sp.]